MGPKQASDKGLGHSWNSFNCTAVKKRKIASRAGRDAQSKVGRESGGYRMVETENTYVESNGYFPFMAEGVEARRGVIPYVHNRHILQTVSGDAGPAPLPIGRLKGRRQKLRPLVVSHRRIDFATQYDSPKNGVSLCTIHTS